MVLTFEQIKELIDLVSERDLQGVEISYFQRIARHRDSSCEEAVD